MINKFITWLRCKLYNLGTALEEFRALRTKTRNRVYNHYE